MKIKVSKEWALAKTMWAYDREILRRGESCTTPTQYATFVEEDVDEDTLLEYIKKGYAIKINCL